MHVGVVVLLIKPIALSSPISSPLLPSPPLSSPLLPSPPLRDTRKSSFYCHAIFNLLGFEYSRISKGDNFSFD